MKILSVPLQILVDSDYPKSWGMRFSRLYQHTDFFPEVGKLILKLLLPPSFIHELLEDYIR